MHPFSLGELCEFSNSTVQDLLNLGGFPEPFFSSSEKTSRRWRTEYVARFLKEDLRDLENIRELSLVELLIEKLPDKVGNPLSIESLRQDLEVSHQTVARWLTILENLYYSFRISPYGAPKIRAVKKEQKLYLWDWANVTDLGFKFENMVAGQLLKYCHFVEDTEGYKMELRYLRDTDGREVDFIVLKEKKPLFAVECKASEKQISPHLRYFKERIPTCKFYQVHLQDVDYESDNIRILPFSQFCKDLKMV